MNKKSLKQLLLSLVILAGTGTTTTLAADYTISTATEWNALAEYIATTPDALTGKTVQITADIDFTGVSIKPLGYDYATAFNGELDGGSHTISGYEAVADSTYFGPIATITGTAAYIHDLTLSGTVTTSYSYTGGAVGKLNGTLSNIVNKGTVSSEADYTGGIAGYTSAATLSACGNEGIVTSSGLYTAGVVGITTDGTAMTGCYNKGTVAYTGSAASCYLAGVVAYFYYGEYTDCWNEGTISASGSGYVSGLFCYFDGTGSSYRSVLTRCYNTSDISATTYVAGLVSYGTSSNTPLVDMYSCYNTGTITSTATSGKAAGLANVYTSGGIYRDSYNAGTVTAGGTYIGGLFGTYRGAPSESLTTSVTGCYNTGAVTSSSNYVGGLFANIYRYVTVDSCYNTGAITGSRYVGGIAGQINSNTYGYINDSWNAGTITATLVSNSNGASVGGIFGHSLSIDTIRRCFNVGTIVANAKYVGGIAGYAYAAIYDCYNTGSLTGYINVGGIVGYKTDARGAVANVYNTGSVAATYSGTVYIGAITGGTGTSVFSNSYYLSTTACENSYYDSYTGTSVTYAQLGSLSMGDNWTAGDNYTYPRITSIADNDYAKAYAAAVVPADGDSYSSITSGFNVGTPDGVTWTALPDVIKFSGNEALFTETYSGTLKVTATCGDASVSTYLTCAVVTTGISSIGSDEAREVVSEKFYTVGGAQVAEPTEGARAIYIVVKTYDDDTTETVKEVR